MAEFSRCLRRCVRAVVVVAALCSSVEAARAEPQALVSAREHFDLGVIASQKGDLSEAVEHFEKARSQGTNPVVLYNLGQTYSALGRPVQAERVLRLYLEQAAALPENAARRAEVESLLSFNQARIGELVVQADPSNATLELDGVPLALSSDAPLRLAAGTHVVVARYEGHHEAVRNVEIRAGSRAEVRLVLPKKAREGVGLVRATCRVPGAKMLLDGVEVGITPETTVLAVAPGDHVFQFQRLGYRSTPLALRVNSAAELEAPCALEPVPGLLASQRGELEIVVNEPRARVTLNGELLRSRFVPAGPHVVEVTEPGYEKWQKIIYAEAGQSKLVLVSLEPTAEQRLVEKRRVRQLWGYATAGAGVFLAGLSTALFLINQEEYGDWREDNRAFARKLGSGGSSGADAASAARMQQRAADIQRMDDITLGTALVSGALFAASIGLLFGGDAAPH